jgi:citrate lyase subunit beta / citryl-CoA lyase
VQPYRSLLFVPAHKPDWVAKALRAEVDAIILDLEDAVPEDAKASARDNLADAIAEMRSTAPHVGAVVRPNAVTSAHGAADLEAAVLAGADVLLVPKVDTFQQLDRLDAVLSHVERRADVDDRRTEVIASLESARGLLNADTIAAAPRLDGALAAAARDGDTARSVGFRWSAHGTETLAFRSRVVLACRAAGERHPVVGLWQDVHDLEGLRTFAEANRDLGFRGQVIIHPAHAEPVNTAYTPAPELVAYYEGMIEAWEAASAEGQGAVAYDGDHIDIAHVRTARETVAFARRLDGDR